EDRTLADADDRAVAFPDTTPVRVAHPALLGEALGTWSELFSDYEILQPFPQLARTVYTLTEAERSARRLERFQGTVASTRAILGLERRGWQRSSPMNAGIQHCLYRELPGGLYVNIKLNPGIAIAISDLDDQELEQIRLDDRPDTGEWAPLPGRPFGDLDPVTASELVADLVHLAETRE
ncbi:DUF4132 domain-containing protein, partial [Actinomadura adrarensis]